MLHGWTRRRRRWLALGPLAVAATLLTGCAADAVSSTLSTPAGSPGAAGTGLPRFPDANQGGIAVCTPAQLANRLPPIIHRPATLPSSQPAPLLIALHGAYGEPQAMEGLSHFEELADQRGFVVAFLAACDLQHPWNAAQDISYVSSTITQLTSNPNIAGQIDPTRVYISGFSAGGAETWLDACKLSRQVAAVAIVSDAMNGQLYSSCKLSKPVSQLLIVGSEDATRWTGVPARLPNPYQTTALWRQLNGCGSGMPQVQQVSTVTQETWTGCTDGSAVALYILHGAGHVWPPYGPGAPQDYPTSAAVWNFLSAFRAAPTSLTGADAGLKSVRTNTKNGKRLVLVRLTVREPLAVTLTFGSGRVRRRLRWQARLSRTGPSQPILQLSIPASVPGGKYTLIVGLTDTYGRTVTLHAVSIPKPFTPPHGH